MKKNGALLYFIFTLGWLFFIWIFIYEHQTQSANNDMFYILIVKLSVATALFAAFLWILRRQTTLFAKVFESEKYYKTLFEQAAVGFCHISTEGRFLKVNEKLCSILGYEEEELLNLDIQSITYQEDLLESLNNIKNLVAGRINNYTIDKRYVKKNGEPIWVRVSVNKAEDRGNKLIYLAGAIEDIDEEVRVKRALRLQKEQMDGILDALPSMVFIKDRKHRMVYANTAAREFLGFSSLEQIKGKTTEELVPQAEAKRIFEEEERVYRDGETLFNFEESITGKDGKTRVILSTRRPFILENGSMGLLGVSTDITDIQEARRASVLLRKFFDNTKEAMVIADKNGNIEMINEAFTTITGYPPKDVKGKNPRVLKSGKHDKAFYEKMWNDILNNGRWVGEIYNKRKNGEIYPEWLAITAIKDDAGNVTNYISSFMDTSHIKESEETIKKQSELLISQSRYAAMGEMIGMIAHQWRQPITAIGMAVNNMLLDMDLQEIDEKTFRSHLGSIGSQVQFLSHTIDDFRNFFKPNTESSIVSVSMLIGEAIKIIGKTLENNNIEVKPDIDSGVESCSISVKAHKGELTQALLVFLGNAKDALVENNIQSPYISIGCKSIEDEYIEIKVCDNGGGVPNELLQKIFEPYFTTKSAKNGTGLGLYIAKTIVEKYQGGSIGVQNENDGACFWMRLPIAKNNE